MKKMREVREVGRSGGFRGMKEILYEGMVDSLF